LLRRSRVVAVSEQIRGLMEGWVPPGGNPVTYIPNGVCPAAYEDLPTSAEARRRHGWPQDECLIGTVSRVSPVKEHENLLRAFAFRSRAAPCSRRVVVGAGPLRPEAEALAERLGRRDRTEFLGDRRDVPELLAALDIFALPSRREG